MTLVGQRVAARMSQHMRMSLESKLGLNTGALDHSCEARRRERRTALRREHEGGFGILLALKPA
jgi:hypothetical protein